jgi:dUTP pyrophosphatase
MIECNTHSETYVKLPIQPKVGQFEKVSYEQFKQAFEVMLDTYETHGQATETVIKQCYDSIELPTRATKGSAGYDFKTPINCTLEVGQTIIIPTGIRCNMDINYMLQMYPRSGLGFKFGMELVNTVGIIDADYYNADNEGHIMVKIRPTIRTLQLCTGDKFAQGIFIPYGITRDDNADGSRTGGIGSTGK